MDAKLFSGKPNSQQIGEVWKYLDELSLKNPEEYDKFIKKTLAEGEAQGFGPPEQCICILTHKVPRVIPVRDFFINVVKWKQMHAPKSELDPIPMTCSELREELINDRICLVVDVAMNPDVIKQCLQKEEEKKMLIDLLVRYVEAANKCKLDSNVKILEDEYKGNKDNLLDMMCPETLKRAARESSKGFTEEKMFEQLKNVKLDEKAASEVIVHNTKHEKRTGRSEDILLPSATNLANELFLKESKHTKKSHESKVNSVDKGKGEKSEVQRLDVIKKPSYVQRAEVEGGAKYSIVEMDLAGVETMNDCELDVGEDMIELLVPGKYELSLKLDEKIDEDETQAIFVRKNSKLIIKMKLL